MVDECSQAKEAAVWILEPRTQKLVLAGDHHQLPPTVQSNSKALAELSISMFERLLRGSESRWTKKCACKLVLQYR